MTENLKDFPLSTLRPLNISAISTDRFLEAIIIQNNELAQRAFTRLHQYLDRDLSEAERTLETLKKTGLRRTQKQLLRIFSGQ